ncbi:VanZ family protein [Streptomyces finlayi]|nr:VanZ family protein [Streptomyces finlayi]
MLVATIVGLVAFSVVLAHVTLTPSPASEDLVRSNLRPGRSLRQYAEDYTFLAACKQAGGNLLLGMPFGVLLPILVARKLRMIRMVLLTVGVMVIVELVQGALVAGRAFDVDDVILNTTGALIGYLLVGRRISHRYHTLGEASPAAEAAPAVDGPDSSKAGVRGVDEAGTKTRTKPRLKPFLKPRGRTGKGRSASAPARVRELITRLRNRGPGKGAGAPRPGRRRR